MAMPASVENLSKIAHISKDNEERNRLLSEGIQTLEKFLLLVEAEPERAFIVGQVGFFYERLENFNQALVYYQRAEKAYGALPDICGRANCLASIARVKELSGKTNEAFSTYYEVKTLLDGSPYYELMAGTSINLGVLQMRRGNLDEAKTLFQEAEFLTRKYNLSYLPALQENLKRLDAKTKARKPPELSLRQLIDELFEWVEWFPEAKDSILRLWMEGRAEVLFSNFRHVSGVKFMICQDHVDEFLRISDILRPFSDLCLQIVDAQFPDAAIDFIPFPMDKKLFFDCAIPYKEKVGGIDTIGFKSGSIKSRYTLTSDRAQSKVTGNEGVVVMGWSPGLPRQAHRLILASSASELLRRRIFFLPADRCRVDDKLLADLDHSHELGLIPMYFASLPESDRVSVVTFASVPLPIVDERIVAEQAKQVRAIKRRLAQLQTSPKSTAQTVLDDLIFEVEELKDITKGKTTLHADIYVLEFPSRLDKDTQVVFVIQDHGMDDLTRNSTTNDS
jgi:tetratricopeptide (TPR) repeat protein